MNLCKVSLQQHPKGDLDQGFANEDQADSSQHGKSSEGEDDCKAGAASGVVSLQSSGLKERKK